MAHFSLISNPSGPQPTTPPPQDPLNRTAVPAPFQWATTRRAAVHNLDYLLSHYILTITGHVRCEKCRQNYEVDFDLVHKFSESSAFVAANNPSMRCRAPPLWIHPVYPSGDLCGEESCVKPIVESKKKSINWLFLLLGQLLGCCTINQLKYFCNHNGLYSTSRGDRVLYMAYLGLCKQIDPNGPFDPY